ncbi:PaaX family transcriptional regulator C-terminal domain-containing protein [Leifsonia sp. fls2-241-R2A-40a]|uniref:PaaX family transcriptional regulator n=1 Tax=Leifsonia sp. fls2-241-R2A-40a TaxID=3040290 RepID=UPI00254C952E|nr:PaaX family transcriptional regulator C-terminal domain-containing protein [Leifsonia sp. fls2-241-R2A-40a]
MSEAAAAREDLEASSGSATALLRTVVGSILRPIGGWMSAAGAVRLMDDLGIPAATARSSLARLCSRGVLRREQRDGVAGYAVDPAAVPMLQSGDARIYGERVEASAWCLVSFSFPEHRRASRDRLRRRLAALGCGSVADGLWIAPAGLEEEVAHAAQSPDGDAAVVLFTDAVPRGDLAEGLSRWYDLPAIRAVHESFLAHFGAAPAPADDAQAFALWMRALDEWRVIPYRDPGLPSDVLPGDWPGAASAGLFRRLRRDLEDRAVAYASAVAAPERTVAAAR